MEITGKREIVGRRAGGRLNLLFTKWTFLLAVADAFALALLAIIVRDLPLPLLAVFLTAIPVFFFSAGLYVNRLRMIMLDQAPIAVATITLAAMVLVTVNFMLLRLPLEPAQIVRLWLTAVLIVPTVRLAASPAHRLAVMAGPKKKTLVVGSGTSAKLVAEKIDAHPELGLSVAGFVDEGPRQYVRGRPEPLLGNLAQLVDVIGGSGAEVVILAFVKNNYAEILKALYQVEPKVEVLIMPRYFEFLSAGVKVDDLAGMPLLGMNQKEQSLPRRLAKRCEDVIVGGALLLLTLPFLPLIALAIKIDSRGPVFFSHARIGMHGKPFRLYKFRSMSQGADKDHASLDRLREEDPRALKNRSDARVTRVGAILRKTSIDELPQLLNVVKGDMSLVGPRPPVAEEVAEYDEWQKKRLSVRPGITGLWQVSGRSDLPFDERIWLDFMYIDSWSPWLDFRILLQTIPAVISMRGAY